LAVLEVLAVDLRLPALVALAFVVLALVTIDLGYLP
jgi:hypothetical protein